MADLYKSCPKCGAGSAGLDICGACGLIFAKYLRAKFAVPKPAQVDGEQPEGRLAELKALAFHIPENPDRLHVIGRALLLAAIITYGIKLALMDLPSWEMASSLIHLPMVPIHESGMCSFARSANS